MWLSGRNCLGYENISLVVCVTTECKAMALGGAMWACSGKVWKWQERIGNCLDAVCWLSCWNFFGFTNTKIKLAIGSFWIFFFFIVPARMIEWRCTVPSMSDLPCGCHVVDLVHWSKNRFYKEISLFLLSAHTQESHQTLKLSLCLF